MKRLSYGLAFGRKGNAGVGRSVLGYYLARLPEGVRFRSKKLAKPAWVF